MTILPHYARRVALLTLLVVISAAPALHAQGLGAPPPLSSLPNGCRLKLSDSEGGHPILWLHCTACRFALLGLASLEGQVVVRTPEQALEFLRLFSSPNTWYLSSLEQMVEVTVGAKADRPRFLVPVQQFAKCCVPATATVKVSPPGVRQFTVRRTIVERDFHVYAIEQIVEENGRVQLTEKTLLNQDGRLLGAFWDPYIM